MSRAARDVWIRIGIAFAVDLEKRNVTLAAQVEQAFRRALGRAPHETEQQRMLTYVREMRAYHDGVNPEPVIYPAKIQRSLVEEFSGRPFEYEEILPVFENYQPDTKPNEVKADTRALADLCLLLFNSNEFLYVY